METVEINGQMYQIGRLSPRLAFHVARRLAPFLGAILPHLSYVFGKNEDGQEPSRKEFMERASVIVQPLAEIVAKLENKDVDYILDTCLSVVNVRGERGFSPVFVNGTMMFQNMDIRTMLELVGEVIKVNLSAFFTSSPQPEQEMAGMTQ